MDWRADTTFWLKPHRGASGLPYRTECNWITHTTDNVKVSVAINVEEDTLHLAAVKCVG